MKNRLFLTMLLFTFTLISCGRNGDGTIMTTHGTANETAADTPAADETEGQKNETLPPETEAPDDGADTFRVAFGFADNGILQRDIPVRIYGDGGKAGRTVTVTFGEQTKTGTVTEYGWEVFLDAMPAEREGRDLTVQYGKVSRTFRNIAVGEVFLCSGQSNMFVDYNYILKKDPGVAEEYHTYDNYSFLRFMNVPVRESAENIRTVHRWKIYESVEKGSDMSALALAFASNLSAMLGNEIPIGIIHCSVPGSSIETWLDPGSTQGLTHFFEGVSEWSCYYNGMLSGFDGYTMRAMLWYQGEADSQPRMVPQYKQKFAKLVSTVRKDNHNDALPFITFQLVQFKEWVPWQEIRQAQSDLAHEMDNVYMVCGIDTGCNIPDNPSAFAADGIHATQKWILGQRAAGLAVSELLKVGYDALAVRTSYGNTPYLSSAVTEGKNVVLNVENAASLTQSEGTLSFFEVFDGVQWTKAEASLRGDQIVLTTSADTPVRVRYLQDDVFPDGTAFIYNEYGNPVPPTSEIRVIS